MACGREGSGMVPKKWDELLWEKCLALLGSLRQTDSSPIPLQDDSTRDGAEAKKTSGLLGEISFVAITWNPESNFTRREKNHSLFR